MEAFLQIGWYYPRYSSVKALLTDNPALETLPIVYTSAGRQCGALISDDAHIYIGRQSGSRNNSKGGG